MIFLLGQLSGCPGSYFTGVDVHKKLDSRNAICYNVKLKNMGLFALLEDIIYENETNAQPGLPDGEVR